MECIIQATTIHVVQMSEQGFVATKTYGKALLLLDSLFSVPPRDETLE